MRICAVITEERVERACAAIEQAARVADLIELRLDYLRDFDFSGPDNLRALLEQKPLPVIITCRATSEGGNQDIDDEARLRLLVEGARHLADFCDIEAAFYDDAAKLSPDISRLIVSYHNFEETPADVESIYERIVALPAAIHKITTRARSLSDSLAIFRLLERARGEGRKLIAIAMNEPGLITRLLGPSYGSFLTYGALSSGAGSAPGQITCEEMRHVYRVNHLTPSTTITGIVGRPVAHSASPAMHNAAFQALGLENVFLPFEVDDLAEFFRRFVRPASRELWWNLRGLSVTIPYKTAVMELLDEIDQAAEKIGAVNTVVLSEEKLVGYNTDAHGAIEPLRQLITLEGASCGVIGAGGAARAVIYGLLERGARVTVFARDPIKAGPVAESLNVEVLPIDSLTSSDVRVVINTTPVGMHGHSEDTSPVPRQALANREVAYDLVYNPIETRFLKDARAEGCQTLSGIEMLISQAARQFKLWTGKNPPLDLMRAAALKKIAGQQ